MMSSPQDNSNKHRPNLKLCFWLLYTAWTLTVMFLMILMILVKVPKSAPESRQPYAGLTLNHATNVVVRDNMVKTELHNDYAYMACCGASIVGDSGNNKVRETL